MIIQCNGKSHRIASLSLPVLGGRRVQYAILYVDVEETYRIILKNKKRVITFGGYCFLAPTLTTPTAERAMST